MEINPMKYEFGYILTSCHTANNHNGGGKKMWAIKITEDIFESDCIKHVIFNTDMHDIEKYITIKNLSIVQIEKLKEVNKKTKELIEYPAIDWNY